MSPIKSRDTQQTPCEECDGKGSISRQKLMECKECGGRGWLKAVDGKEPLCSKCNGDGSVNAIDNLRCDVCEGRGYSVRIIETETEIMICTFCDATGIHYKQSGCPECDGIGQVEDHEHPSAGTCPDCNGSGRSPVRRDHQCELCRGSGKIIRYMKCPKCLGERVVEWEERCPYCEGKRYHVGDQKERDITPKPRN